jgi:hypothetical protein
MPGSSDKRSRSAVHVWLLLAAGSLYFLSVSLAIIGAVAALIVRRILLSPVLIHGWRNLELIAAFFLAVHGLGLSAMIALFCFRTKARPTAVGDGPGLPMTRLDAPGFFEIADQLSAELRLSRLPEFRADLGGGIVCPGQFIQDRKFLQMVVLGLPVLTVLPAAEFTEVLRMQLRLTGVSPGLHFRVIDVYHRLRVVRELSGRKSVLLPVEYVCRHALQAVAAYAGDGATVSSSISDNIGNEFTRYVVNHVNPLIATGHFPPVTEGFRRHWNSLDGVSPIATTAISLINNLGVLEERLANATIARTAGLERVSWEQASTVLLSSWLESAARVPEPIRELNCRDVAGVDLLQLGHRMYDRPGRLYDQTQLRSEVCRSIAVALVAAVTKAGWHFDYVGPGTKYQFSKDSHTVLPFSMADGLLRGDGIAAWKTICTDAGIADLQMG